MGIGALRRRYAVQETDVVQDENRELTLAELVARGQELVLQRDDLETADEAKRLELEEHEALTLDEDATDEQREAHEARKSELETAAQEAHDALTALQTELDSISDRVEAQKPKKSASKGDWFAFAQALGAEPSDELTKPELIELVG